VVNYADGTRAAEYYADVSQNVYAVKTGFLEAALITGDTMLVSSFPIPLHKVDNKDYRFTDFGWSGVAITM
jgi:hypothetical protein